MRRWTQTLCELIQKLERTRNPVDCIISDSLLNWALDVAKRYELVGASFRTQNLVVNSISYHVKIGKPQLPLFEDANTCLLGFPLPSSSNMPTSLHVYALVGPVVFDFSVGQYSNIDKVDWILCNTIYKPETEE